MTADQWFTFEGRCLLCGRKYEPHWSPGLIRHLNRHVTEGYMKRHGDDWTKVKEHPVGFPGAGIGEAARSTPEWPPPPATPARTTTTPTVNAQSASIAANPFRAAISATPLTP